MEHFKEERNQIWWKIHFLKATDKKVIFWCGCWITIDIVFPDIFHYCRLIWPTSCIRAILTVWQGQILKLSHKQLFLNCLSPLPVKPVPITAFKYDSGLFFLDSAWALALYRGVQGILKMVRWSWVAIWLYRRKNRRFSVAVGLLLFFQKVAFNETNLQDV